MEEFMDSFLRKNLNIRQENARNMPKVIAAKRLKFYKGIGKSHLLEASEVQVNPEDEHLIKKQYNIFPNLKPSVINFCDDLVITEFENLKRPEFDLNDYIKAVKFMYRNWLDDDNVATVYLLRETLVYLLAHARDFNNPSKNLYIFSETGTKELEVPNVDDNYSKDDLPGHSKYVISLNNLIADLQQTYDETKYQKLNLNATYMLLLMARTMVKNGKEFKNSLHFGKTHDDYANLCPDPLDSRLPAITKRDISNWTLKNNFDNILTIIITYGYNLSKGKMRKVFRQTCINYMEYNGLGLFKLFYDVVRLYNTEDYKLWDVMSMYLDCCDAVFNLANLVHYHQELKNSNPPKTYNLFPFCRLVNQNCHTNLSSNNNDVACYALSVLIDLKLGLDKSFARNATWTKKNVLSPKGELIANDMLKKLK